MMKTLSDKAVTNQSRCERWRTVKDVSGQSSHALVRRNRPVTVNSHAALFCLQSHRKAFCSRHILRHPITGSNLPTSFPHFVMFSWWFVLVVEASQRHAGCSDISGQLTEFFRGSWSDVWACPNCRRHQKQDYRHTHPVTTAPLLPAFPKIRQRWQFLTPAQIFLPPSVSTCCFLLSGPAAHFSF